VLLQSIPFMTDAGHSRASAAMAILVASLPAMLTKPVWGWLVDHMDPKPLAACSAFISGVSVLLIVASINGPDVRFAYAAFALLGIGWGGMIPLQEVIWALYFGRRHLGSVRSAALPFALVMGAGGPLAVAHYCDVVGHYDGAFVAVGLMSIVAAVLILALPKLEQQRPPYR
jgi:MFS family permease